MIDSSDRCAGRMHRISLLIAALVCLPHAAVLGTTVVGHDSPEWIDLGRIQGLDGLFHLMTSRHFIGYRPLTALTFVPGWREAWLHHGIDLLILFLCIVRLHRWLLSIAGLSRGLCLLSVAAFAWHPVLEEIIPYPSRRADLLLTLFGIEYLHALTSGSSPWRRCLLLFLAVCSKEPAFALPIAAAIALLPGAGGRLSPRVLVPDFAVLFVAALLRLWVLGGVGGYETDKLVGNRAWIGLDYAANLLVPHLLWMRQEAPLVSVVLLVLSSVTFLSLVTRCWRTGAMTRVCVAALVLDFALYLVNGFVWPRLLAYGLALFIFVCASCMASFSGIRQRIVAVSLLLIVGLELASAPWKRIQGASLIVERYVTTLTRALKSQSAGPISMALLDVPAVRVRPWEERRIQWSAPLSAEDADLVPLLPPPPLVRMLRWQLPDKSLEVLPLLSIAVEDLNADWEVRISDGAVDDRLTIALRASAARFTAHSSMPGFVFPPSRREAHSMWYSFREWQAQGRPLLLLAGRGIPGGRWFHGERLVVELPDSTGQ